MPSRNLSLLPVCASCLALLAACGDPPAPVGTETAEAAANPPSPGDVHYSYVLLASSGGTRAAYARLITDEGYDCPAVAASCAAGGTRPMTARRKPIFDSVAHCPAGGCFPVQVCEAAVPFDQKSQVCLDGGVLDLPEPTGDPSKILVMGDTGCKDPNHRGGDCVFDGSSTVNAEPFASQVTAAGTGFDLVLHMGDYNYRGTPASVPWETDPDQDHWAYDAGDGAPTCQQASGIEFLSQANPQSLLPDQWDIWRKDFFEPAKPLLEAAPWVFARGNHELCSRAGPGWFYFLDAGFAPDGTQIDCPALPPGDDLPRNPSLYTRIAPLYQVELEALNLIVLDSANACDDGVPAEGNSFRTAYEDQFRNLSVAADGNPTWIVSHRPFWSNETLQVTSSKDPDDPKGEYLAGIGLSLAGHKHLFESITPATAGSFPAELVTGNGGVELEGAFDTCCRQTLAGETVWVQGALGHGFVHLDFDPVAKTWSGKLLDGSTLTASCDPSHTPSLCTVPGATCPSPSCPAR